MPADEDIGFDCEDKINGFYASVKYSCQVSEPCRALYTNLFLFLLPLFHTYSYIITVSMVLDRISYVQILQHSIKKHSYVILCPRLTVKIHTDIGAGKTFSFHRFIETIKNRLINF